MRFKSVLLFIPLIALVAYTFGIFFLIGSDTGIYLSPGGTSVKNTLNLSLILLVLAGALVIGAIFVRGEKNEK